MKLFLAIAATLLLAACSAEPGSQKWCAAKAEQSKSEWTASDLATYTRNCLIDGTAVGSESWCKDMSDKPKGEWTADDTATYAKHCVL
ncbi:MAG: DUF3012 domain-containing protein [Gammaproteobacteria bacterium]|jgi:hypothetical protein|nr:DUF3012 domain-containing protein [Gammaproteobacteria bacterium]